MIAKDVLNRLKKLFNPNFSVIGQMFGVSRLTIYNWQNEKSQPDAVKLDKLIKVGLLCDKITSAKLKDTSKVLTITLESGMSILQSIIDGSDFSAVADEVIETLKKPATGSKNPTDAALEGEVIEAQYGRPTKYRPEMIQHMLMAMENGASDTKVMKILKISRDTFYRWLKDIDEFKEAHDYGQIAVESFWDDIAEFGINNPKELNTNLYIAYMKKRFKSWRDAAPAGTGDSTTINVGSLTVNTLKALSAQDLELEIQKRLKSVEQIKLIKTLDNDSEV